MPRDHRHRRIALLRVVEAIARHRRVDQARRDVVHVDPVLGHFARQTARKRAEPGLGDPVRRAFRRRQMLRDRRNVHDPPTAAHGTTLPDERAATVQRPQQIGPQHGIDLRILEIGDGRTRRTDARVVHQHLESAERIHRFREERVDRPRVAYIGLDRARAPAQCLDASHRFLRAVMVRVVDDRDVRAFLREQRRDRLADSGVRTRDERANALQFHVPVPPGKSSCGKRAAARRRAQRAPCTTSAGACAVPCRGTHDAARLDTHDSDRTP